MSLGRIGSKAPLMMALIAMAAPAAYAQTSGYFFTLPSTNSVATYTTGAGGALVAGPVVSVGGSGVFAAAADPTSHYLYLTAQGSNQVFGFVIGTTGGLTAVAGSPFAGVCW